MTVSFSTSIIDLIKKKDYLKLIESSQCGVKIKKGKDTILLTTLSTCNLKYRLARQANGIVIHKGKIVVLPKETLMSIKSSKELTRLLNSNKYKCYEVHNGTIIHLYYLDIHGVNSWVFSTRNMFNIDIKNDSYISSKILDDCGIKPSILDKRYTYTYILKHPDLHKLTTAASSILDRVMHGIKIVSNHETGTLVSEKDRDDIVEIMKRPFNECIDSKSFEPVLAGEKSNMYGVILRSQYSNLLIESRLYRFIREVFYDNQQHKGNCSKVLEYHYRKSTHKDLIRKLWPEFPEVYDLVDDHHHEVRQDLISFYKNKTPTKYPDILKRMMLEIPSSFDSRDYESWILKYELFI